MKQNIIIFGSSSEICRSFIKLLNENYFTTYTISRADSTNTLHLKVTDYIDEIEAIKNFVKDIENPFIVFFNGYLAENRSDYEPSSSEIAQTDYINFQVPYILTNEINKSFSVKKFIYISSIASIKPRLKNYIYGLSKRKLEKSLKFLNLNSFLVIKFGKIETNMSKDHKSPPFTISSEQAAKIIFKKLNKKGVVMSNYKLLASKLIILFSPQSFINRF